MGVRVTDWRDAATFSATARSADQVVLEHFKCSATQIKHIQNLARGFGQSHDLSVNCHQDGADWWRWKFNDDFRGQRPALFEDGLRHGFAANALLLPAWRKLSTASNFFGQARRKIFIL